MLGLERDEWVGRSAFDLVHPDDVSFAALSLASVQDKEVGSLIEVRVRAADGWRVVEAHGANRLSDPDVSCVVVTVRDLTERRRWELGRSDDAVFRSVVNNSASLLMLVDHDGTIMSVSNAVARLLGLDPETLERQPLESIVEPHDRRRVRRALTQSAPGSGHGDPVTMEVSLLSADGRPVPFELTLVTPDDPTLGGIVVSGHSITKLRLYQRALADLALKDPLTMLPNRTAADNHIEALGAAHTSARVAFVDLDDFKHVNDRYGHLVGDQVLCAVADRLSVLKGRSDLVARYGGDEFVVVVDDRDSAGSNGEDGLTIRLLDAFDEPFDADGHTILQTASIGVATLNPSDSANTVLGRADHAMYSSKRRRQRTFFADQPTLRSTRQAGNSSGQI